MFVMDRFLDAFHRALVAGRPPRQTPRVLRQDDVRAAAKRAGFEVGEFVTQTIDGEPEVFATATR